MSTISYGDHSRNFFVNGTLVTHWMVDNKEFEDLPSVIAYLKDTLDCTGKEARDYLRDLPKVNE